MQVQHFQNSKCFSKVLFCWVVLCFILIAVKMYLQGRAKAFSTVTPLLLCYARATPTQPENGVKILIKMTRKYKMQFSLRDGP